MTACVYRITHRESGKSYIGKAKHAKARWQHHRADARRSEPQSFIGRALRKYGLEAFDFEVVEHLACEADALRREEWWIQRLGTMSPAGYNLSPGGDGPSHSAERRKMSVTRRGKPHSPAHNAAVAAAAMGNRGRSGQPHTVETRARISAAHMGRQKSPEHIAKHAAALRGRKHSADHKAKIGAALKARTNALTDEERRRMSESLRSPEAQERYRAAMASPEVRAKMSAAQQRRRLRAMETSTDESNPHTAAVVPSPSR